MGGQYKFWALSGNNHSSANSELQDNYLPGYQTYEGKVTTIQATILILAGDPP